MPTEGVYRAQSFHTFQILKLKSEAPKKIVQCTKKIVLVDQSHHDRSPNEKSI